MALHQSYKSRFRLVARLAMNGAIPLGIANLFGAASLTLYAFSIDRAVAQIAPDATLGAESSVIAPNVDIGGFPSDRIDGGALRGANLFHSFLEFNVGETQRVYFANPAGIENILGRVTGTDPSDILGTLGVNGSANLFLLNPNGIIFGLNAKLDVAGSFLASTANTLVFENGFEFSATNPQTPPLLAINVPLGLQYGANPSGFITNAGNLAAGQNLTLSARTLNLQGQLHAGRDLTLEAQDSLRVRDSATTPFIAAARGRLLVQGSQSVDIFALNHPNSGFFSGETMVMRSASPVGGDAHYWSGGSFRVEQLDGTLGQLFSPGDPVIRANGDVVLDSYAGASLHIFAGGSVSIPGTVQITGADTPANSIAETVTLSDGTTTIAIDGRDRPTLDIRAGIDWTKLGGLPGNSVTGAIGVPAPVLGGGATSADITIGDIFTDFVSGDGGRIFLTNQYSPNDSLNGQIQVGGIDTTDDFGGGSVTIDSRNGITLTGLINTSIDTSGSSGDVTLFARGDISLTNGGAITSTSASDDTSDYAVITIKSTEGSVFLNEAELNTTNSGNGFAGDILIDAPNQVVLANQSVISSEGRFGRILIGDTILPNRVAIADDGTQVSTTGLVGKITINAREQVAIENSQITNTSDNDESEQFGVIDIIAIEGSVFLNNAQLSTTNSGTGLAGDILIDAPVQVAITGQSIIQSDGQFGRILIGDEIAPRTVTINSPPTTASADTPLLRTTTSGSERGGDISISAINSVAIANSRIFSDTDGSGNAGSISVSTDGSITIANGFITSEVFNDASGDGGEVELIGDSIVLTDSTRLRTNNLGTGTAGSIFIQAGSLFVNTGTQVVSDTSGQGDAGDLLVQARDLVEVTGEGSFISADVLTGAEGEGGILTIETGSLSVRDGAVISVNTFGVGDAGGLFVQASDSVEVVGEDSFISANVKEGAEGDGGFLTLETGSLSVRDGAEVSADTDGFGNAGDLLVQARDLVEIVGANSFISADVLTDAEGEGGILTIETGSLSVRDGGVVSVNTSGLGNAGDLLVQARDLVEVVGEDSFISANVNEGAEGDGGFLTLETGSLSVRDGSVVSVDTNGFGDAGGLFVQAGDLVEVVGANSFISADVLENAEGDGGFLTIETGRLSIRDGGVVSSDTYGLGDAGDLFVDARETVEVIGEGSFLSTEVLPGAVGLGGDVTVQTRELRIQDGAEVSVSSEGSGEAGNLEIEAGSIYLNNRGQITGETVVGNGGNITLRLREVLLLRNESLISTTAGTEGKGGDGGNIEINADFVVGISRENSDITANAFNGRGGRVAVTAQGIFGITPRDRLTPLSDITASSALGPQFNGVVEINTPDVDPSRGLTQLPTDLVDAASLIDRSCASAGGKLTNGRFTLTGRGGLPLNPGELLDEEGWIEDLGTPASVMGGEQEESPDSAPPTSATPERIVEAQSWVKTPDGQVILVAHAPTVTPEHLQLTSPSCQVVP